MSLACACARASVVSLFLVSFSFLRFPKWIDVVGMKCKKEIIKKTLKPPHSKDRWPERMGAS